MKWSIVFVGLIVIFGMIKEKMYMDYTILFVVGAAILGVVLGLICRRMEYKKEVEKLIRWSKRHGRKGVSSKKRKFTGNN